MKSKAKRNNHKPDADAALPTKNVCIDEDEAVTVFDYLNGSDQNADKELVAAHLELCSDCKRAVAALVRWNPAIRRRLVELRLQEELVVA